MSSNNSIQVAIKVCPLLAKEKDAYWNVAGNTISLKSAGVNQSEPYCFDYVFDQDSNQIVFDKMAKHIVHSAVRGFNGTIFAYGQTASGKTYTMMGGENDPGVMVLAAQEVFNEIGKTPGCQFLLRGGFMEIYNEKIYDLLNKSNQELKIYETASGNAHVNCEEFVITSEDQLLQLLQIGNDARTVGETNMNERSSRSHAIFRLIIESRQKDCEDDDVVTQSVLNLVDLAGSERADQTGASGARLKEGGHINKSLLFLSTVIKQLSENEDNTYISYRSSKLTRILQASLGGNAFTSIICTVKSTSVEETQSTLSFALRAKTIKNRPHVNEIVSDTTMMKRLIKDLRKQLSEEKLKIAQIEKLFVDNTTANSHIHKENRRRTWCPAATYKTDMYTPTTASSSNLIQLSNLNMPLSLLTVRDVDPEEKLQEMPVFEVFEEEFQPAEFVDFNNFPLSPKTPGLIDENSLKIATSEERKPSSSDLMQLLNLEMPLMSLITVRDVGSEKKLQEPPDLEVFEEEFQPAEFVDFNKFPLSPKMSGPIDDKSLEISSTEEREGENMTQYLTTDKVTEKPRLFKIEDQDATSCPYEFEPYRSKNNLRVKELLEVIDEKDLLIAELEEQLNILKANRKEELMQLTCNTTDDSTENNCSDGRIINTDDGKSAVCHKCEDLQRLLDENKKVALEFDKLTIQYKELQNNYQKLADDALRAKTCLSELNKFQSEASQSLECEQLRNEIVALRLKLKNIEHDYEEVKSDREEKSERSESLGREVELAQKQLCMLQDKYVILEGDWQKQKETIAVIKADYEFLEKKYNDFKTTYESLEHCSTKCTANCLRLQNENDGLQIEIQKLKKRIEGMQEELLDGWGSKNEVFSKEEGSSEECFELRSENAKLQVQLKELQVQYEQLQQEYDQLSTNIMETVQENDMLMASCNNLEANLKESENYKSALDAARISWEAERHNLMKRISELQRKLEGKSLTTSNTVSETLMSDDKLKNYSEVEHHQSEQSAQQVQETILKLETLVRTLQNENEVLFLSSQRDIVDLREQIKNLTAELCERSSVLDELVKEKAEITLLNEELQLKIAKSQSDFTTSFSATSFGNQYLCGESTGNVNEMSHNDAPSTNKNELMDEKVETLSLSQSKLELLENYSEEWELSQRKIEQLEKLLKENGISSVNKENPVEQDDNNAFERSFENDDDNDMLKIEGDYDNYSSFHEDNKSSTSTSPSTSAARTDSYLKFQKSRMEKSEMIQQCNSEILKLCEVIEEAKAANLQLSEILTEKDKLLQAKEEEIKNLEALIEVPECKVTEMNGLEEKASNLENELEIIKTKQEKDEERSILLARIDELMEQSKTYTSELREMEQGRTEMQLRLETLLNEKEELQSKMDEIIKKELQTEADKKVMKGAVEAAQKEIADQHMLNEKFKQEFEEMVKERTANLEIVADSEAQMKILKYKLIESEKSFQREKTKLLNELEECKATRNELKEKSEAISLKMDAFAQELHESKLHSASLEKTLQEYEGLEKQLEISNQRKTELELEVISLRKELKQLTDTLNVTRQSERNRIEELEAKLEDLQSLYTEATEQHEALCRQATKLSDEQKKLQRAKVESQSKLNELKLKCASLEETNSQLITTNKMIQETLSNAQRDAIEHAKIHKLLREVQDDKLTLQAHIEATIAEHEKISTALQMKLEEQEKACKNIRASLNAKESDFENAKLVLEQITANLQIENETLIKRLESANEIIKKRTDACQSANNSMERSTYSQNSPRAHYSPSMTMKHVSAEDKVLSIEKERKNRRLSAHDENRRQSAKVTVYVDASMTTEPFINDCECHGLKEQLKECETQLFIRQSQVTALKLELRHHPLKAEKVSLVKRIHEERAKSSLEIKKYQNKVAEQAATIQALTEQAGITVLPVYADACTSPRNNTRSAVTQTDMEIDKSLQQLQGKYNDLKKICRFRYNRIISLEKLVEEKENLCGQCAAANRGKVKPTRDHLK